MSNLSHTFVYIMYIILGILSIVYYTVIKLRGVTFAPFFLICGLMLIGSVIARLYFKNICLNKKEIIIYRLFKYAIAFLVISFFVVEAFIIYWGSREERVNAGYVIILGAGVRGTTPSLTLNERLKTALLCIKKNPEAKIILSGGKGPGEDISEAEAMRIFFINNGINENKLILEEKSRNTRENIVYSKRIINGFKEEKNKKVILVTSNFHMMRAHFLARRAGLDIYCDPAPIPLYLAPAYFIREYFAFFKSILIDKV